MPFPPAEPAEGIEAKPVISKKNEIVLFSSTAIALYGYDQGMMSMVNTNRSYLKTMQIAETSPIVGIIVSVYYLGCAVGAVVASDWADKKGRKPSIFACLVTAILGNLLMFVAGLGPHGSTPWGGAAIACMIAGRVVLGLAVGGIDATIPVYSAELSKDEARGKALAQEFQMNIFGLLMAFSINLIATSVLGKDSEWAWRIPIVAMQIFPVLLLSLISRLPETPRWYMSKWRKEEAKEALVTLHGEEKAKDMLQGLSTAQREEDDNNEKIGYMDMLLPSGSQFHPSMVTVMGQINQALTGYGAVSVYGPQVFELLGFGVRDAEYVTLGNFISYFLFMTVAWLWIDRYGRRKLMVWGSVGLSTCFALLSVFGALSLDVPSVSRLAAEIPGSIVMFVATAIFGICWLATVWLIPTEIYPSSARAQGSAISVIVWGLANFTVTLLTPIVFNNLKYWLFLAFTVTNAFAGWWTWRYSPESGGRSFEENQEFFNSAQEENSWVVRKVDGGKFLQMPPAANKDDSVEEATPLLRSRH
ncbi:general substrate transporter [Apiospora arundinis]|uniref:General substrate transporter n=1 Tax=Apiospora arundinis TaxID=335852 RepID=A0ABR2HY92_9PEZI